MGSFQAKFTLFTQDLLCGPHRSGAHWNTLIVCPCPPIMAGTQDNTPSPPRDEGRELPVLDGPNQQGHNSSVVGPYPCPVRQPEFPRKSKTRAVESLYIPDTTFVLATNAHRWRKLHVSCIYQRHTENTSPSDSFQHLARSVCHLKPD